MAADTECYPAPPPLAGSSLDDNPRVRLCVSCSELVGKHWKSIPNPLVVVFLKRNTLTYYTEYGRTEWLHSSCQPQFTTTIEMDYQFAEVQPLKFCVYGLDTYYATMDLSNTDLLLGSMECTLGEVVSSSPITLSLATTSSTPSGYITVRAVEVPYHLSEMQLQFGADDLDRKDFLGKSDPYLKISKINPDGSFTVLHQTEVVKNSLCPLWDPFVVTNQTLCGKDPERTIRVQCFDWNSRGSPDFIGYFDTCLAELETNDRSSWECINPEKAKKKKYKHSGVIQLHSLRQRNVFNILEFISTGCKLCCTVAIDLTIRNGHSSDADFLHTLDPENTSNPYLQALPPVLELCQAYSKDRIMSAVEVGGQYYWKVTDATPLNKSQEEYRGVAEIMEAYRNSVQYVSRGGPLNFAPVINSVAKKATASKHIMDVEQKYHILLIFTSGRMSDYMETRRAIVAASSLPMSIIVVAVGKSYYNLENLEGDNRRISYYDDEAVRDIVHLVKYQKYAKAPPHVLTREVFSELPDQLTNYMETNHIIPQKLQ